MLVLSRKIGEKIIINDEIEVVVIDASAGAVRIGINAPKNVSIFREELYREIQSANKTSNDTSFDALNAIQSLLKEENKTSKAQPADIIENLTTKLNKE